MEGRILLATKNSAHENLALEEAILRNLNIFTIRIWRNQKSVIIGRSQLASLETDLELCRKLQFSVVRRISGGGAIYNGPGNINWSFFIPEGYISNLIYFTRDVKELLSTVGSFMARCFTLLGCYSRYKESAIYSSEGKISGISAYITKDKVLCHGTLLTNADLEIVQKLTTPKEESAERKYRRSNCAKIANSWVRYEELVSKIIEMIGIDYVKDEESYEESMECMKLTENKYIKESWNLGDPFEFE
jgi:lipoate-protein ligase A